MAKSKGELIADDMRERIRSGEFKPGERLPDTAELTLHYRVSNSTVALGLARLVGEGLVWRARFQGSWVTERGDAG